MKHELSECEIKLKQSQHEKDILRRENEILRSKIKAFAKNMAISLTRADLNELFAKTTLTNAFRSPSPSLEIGYHHTINNTEDFQYLLTCTPNERRGTCLIPISNTSTPSNHTRIT